MGVISILSWFSAFREYKLAKKKVRKQTLISGISVALLLTILTLLSMLL
jgi:hypothetical protein